MQHFLAFSPKESFFESKVFSKERCITRLGTEHGFFLCQTMSNYRQTRYSQPEKGSSVLNPAVLHAGSIRKSTQSVIENLRYTLKPKQYPSLCNK